MENPLIDESVVRKYEVNVAKSIKEVEGLRNIWEKMECHPNVDIDYYLTIVDSLDNILRPHVVVFSKNGQPEAMAVGRLERRYVGITIGYKTIVKFKVPCLTILYGGLLGAWSDGVSHMLVAQLMDSLKRNEADVVFLNLLRSDTELYELAKTKPGFICSDHVTERNLHWKMTLENGIEGFLERMTSKHRYWLRRLPRVLEKEFPNKVLYKYYQRKDDLEQLFSDAEEIAKTTYQRDIDSGFMDNREMRRRLELSAEKGWLRGYILYVDKKPCSFWIGTLYNNIFHLDFTGYDSTYKRYETGTILFMRMIEDLYKNNVGEVDFGFGDAFYKQRFGDRNWIESSVYIYAPTIKGIMINLIRTFNLVPYGYVVGVADRTKILHKIKKVWRDMLIKNKNVNNQ